MKLIESITEPNDGSTLSLFSFPSPAVLRGAGAYAETLFVASDLRSVRVGGAVYEIPDRIAVRFVGAGSGAEPTVAIRLTANIFHSLIAQFDGSPAASDPVMVARMQAIFDAWYGDGDGVGSVGGVSRVWTVDAEG
jgi:hypothetical protein